MRASATIASEARLNGVESCCAEARLKVGRRSGRSFCKGRGLHIKRGRWLGWKLMMGVAVSATGFAVLMPRGGVERPPYISGAQRLDSE